MDLHVCSRRLAKWYPMLRLFGLRTSVKLPRKAYCTTKACKFSLKAPESPVCKAKYGSRALARFVGKSTGSPALVSRRKLPRRPSFRLAVRPRPAHLLIHPAIASARAAAFHFPTFYGPRVQHACPLVSPPEKLVAQAFHPKLSLA
jgi:hypothetical protein